MDDKQLAAFEAWASEKWLGVSFSPDQNNCGLVVAERYKHTKLQAAWEAYQAALASPEVQALIVEAYERGLQDGRREGDDFIAGCLA